MTDDEWIKLRHAPGGVMEPECYAQGKMLNHSSWFGHLPRGITPSDIDVGYASGLWFLLCENKRRKEIAWLELPTGQRRLYEDLVRATRGQALAVLWCHMVPVARPVDSMLDCLGFVVICSPDGRPPRFTLRFEGAMWPGFVALWYANPRAMRDACVVLASTVLQEAPLPPEEPEQLTLGGGL